MIQTTEPFDFPHFCLVNLDRDFYSTDVLLVKRPGISACSGEAVQAKPYLTTPNCVKREFSPGAPPFGASQLHTELAAQG